jgi:hypothetical protein
MTQVTFNLKCAGCGFKESRQISHHDEPMPFCPKCYGPMMVERVAVKQSQANRGGVK